VTDAGTVAEALELERATLVFAGGVGAEGHGRRSRPWGRRDARWRAGQGSRELPAPESVREKRLRETELRVAVMTAVVLTATVDVLTVKLGGRGAGKKP